MLPGRSATATNKSLLVLFFRKEHLPFPGLHESTSWRVPRQLPSGNLFHLLHCRPPDGINNLMNQEDKLAADLAAAGAGIDKAVEELRDRGLGHMPIASAMLGGALGLLAQVMDDNAILNVLHSAATGVSSGELRRSLKEG